MLRRACRPSVLVALSVIALGGPAAGAGPAAASDDAFTASNDAVVAYSDAEEFVGAGRPSAWRGTDSTITAVSYQPGELTVAVDGGAPGDYLTLELASAPGTPLTTGVYASAERMAFRSAGRPGLDIRNGRACSSVDGAFEIRDIARRPDGSILRLWAIYEQRCGDDDRALWGEIRLGLPTPTTVPSVVRWPANDVGAPRATVPVSVPAGDRAFDVRSVSVSGLDAGDVSVVDDACTNRTVAAGSSCTVRLGFEPRTPGQRQALLAVVDARGRRFETALQGWSYGGTTDFRVEGDPGDWITGGASTVVTPATGRILLGGGRQRLHGYVRDGAGRSWFLDVAPGAGDAFTGPATYAPVERFFSPRDAAPGLDLNVTGRGCDRVGGSFGLEQPRWREDDRLLSGAVRFEQHCEKGAPAARGRLRYRDGDTTTPAPWMRTSAEVTSLTAPPEATPTSPPPATAPTSSPTAPSAATSPPAAERPTTAQGASPLATATSASGSIPASSERSPAPARASTVVYRGLRDGGRTLRYTVSTPGPGTATLTPWIRVGGRTVALGRRSTSASRGGARTVSVTVPRPARAAVRRAGRSVRLSTRLTWAARGAAPATSRTVVPLRGR